jgi:hypothetical protein
LKAVGAGAKAEKIGCKLGTAVVKGSHLVVAANGVYEASQSAKEGDYLGAGLNLLVGTMSLKGLAGGNKYCFTEGTQIVVGMEYDTDGNFVSYVTANIEDIKVGDLVYSYDTATGEVSQKEVTSTSALRSDHINKLTIVDEDGNEQVIETTDTHPFWVVTDDPDLERAARELADGFYHENITPGLGGFWVEAKDLRVGDAFLGANDELSTLINIVRVEQTGGIAVFNFTVEGNHNYFILAKEYEYGQTSILVHNGTCIRNAHLAGKNHPKTGIPFDKDGFPNFSSVAQKEVRITLTGNVKKDFAAANKAAGLDRTPPGMTWHHHQDMTTMQLVPTDIHSKTGHTGGFILWLRSAFGL